MKTDKTFRAIMASLAEDMIAEADWHRKWMRCFRILDEEAREDTACEPYMKAYFLFTAWRDEEHIACECWFHRTDPDGRGQCHLRRDKPNACDPLTMFCRAAKILSTLDKWMIPLTSTGQEHVPPNGGTH